MRTSRCCSVCEGEPKPGIIGRMSLLGKTILFFVVLLFIAVLVVVVSFAGFYMTASMRVERGYAKDKLEVVANVLRRDLSRVTRYIEDYAYSDEAVEAIAEAENGNVTHLREYLGTALIESHRISIEAVWSASGKLLLTLTENFDPPVELQEPTFLDRIEKKGNYCGVFAFPEPFFGCLNAIYPETVTPTMPAKAAGYVLFAKGEWTTYHDILGTSQACAEFVTVNSSELSEGDMLAVATLSSTASSDAHEWGKASLLSKFAGATHRCPNDRNETSSDISAYILLRDPIAGHGVGPLIRITHQLNVRRVGGKAVHNLLLPITMAALVIFGIVIVLFLELVVLRRIRKFSEQLRGTMAEARSDSPGMGDEVSKLEVLLRYRMKTLTREFDDVTEERRDVARTSERHVEALDLMNVICRRSTPFPEDELIFRPAVAKDSCAAAGRAQPTGEPSLLSSHDIDGPPQPPAATASNACKRTVLVDIAGMMENPIAVEFLKDYMRTNDLGVGPVLFLLGVMHMVDEPSKEKRLLRAASLYRRFLSTTTGKYRLGLKHHRSSRVKDAIKSGSTDVAVTLLQSITDEVANELSRSTLPRMRKTFWYKDLIAVLRAECGGELSGPHVVIRDAASVTTAEEFIDIDEYEDEDEAGSEDDETTDLPTSKSRTGSFDLTSGMSPDFGRASIVGSSRRSDRNRRIHGRSSGDRNGPGDDMVELESFSSTKGEQDDDHFALSVTNAV